MNSHGLQPMNWNFQHQQIMALAQHFTHSDTIDKLSIVVKGKIASPDFVPHRDRNDELHYRIRRGWFWRLCRQNQPLNGVQPVIARSSRLSVTKQSLTNPTAPYARTLLLSDCIA